MAVVATMILLRSSPRTISSSELSVIAATSANSGFGRDQLSYGLSRSNCCSENPEFGVTRLVLQRTGCTKGQVLPTVIFYLQPTAS